MSSGVFVQDAPEVHAQLEEQVIIERASVEPEPTDENARLLGYSKRPFPKRLILLMFIIVLFTTSAISTGAAGLDVTYKFMCYFLHVDKDQCLRSDIAGEKVANFTGILAMIRGGFALIFSTYLSFLSDRLGRKPIVVTAMVLTSLSHISSWYIVFHLPNPGTYWWLVFPTVVDGFGGGANIVAQMCVAYVSDMVPDPTQRARLLALVDGCFFGSLAAGPAIGSWIIRTWNIEVLYISTVCGALLAALLSVIYLRESLSSYHKRRNSTTKKNVTSSLSVLLFKNVENRSSRRNARVMVVMALLGTEFAMSFVVVLMLYPKRKFEWTAIQSGYLVSTMSSTRTLWFVIGFPFIYARLSKVWRVHSDSVDKVDLTLLRLGILCSISGYLLMGYSQTQSQFFVSGIIDACSSIGLPIYKSAMLKHVDQGQFGAYMAAFNFVCSLATVFAPSMFLKLYSWAFTWRPYLPFEVVGTLFIVLFFTTFLIKPAN